MTNNFREGYKILNGYYPTADFESILLVLVLLLLNLTALGFVLIHLI